MCNAISKSLLAGAALMLCCACGDSTAKQEKAAADAVLSEIQRLMVSGDLEQARQLVDTLNLRYPDQIEARRAVTRLLPTLMVKLSRQQIAVADSVLDAVTAEYAEILPEMLLIDGEDEHYYIVAGSRKGTMKVEPRVSNDYQTMYIVARNDGKSIGLNQVALVGADGSACTGSAIPAGNDRAMSVEGSELAVFINQEVDTLGHWAYDRGNVTSARLIGTKGTADVKLTAEQAASFGKAWHFADVMQRKRQAEINRERLERQLLVAQKQENQL